MNENNLTDEYWMRYAIALAEKAAYENEVPVGAVLIHDQKIIGEGYNQPIRAHDPTAHAEIIALREASQKLMNYRLTNTTLYVTLEPCAMCCGAIIHARVSRLIFATADPKTGAVGSVLNLFDYPFNHHVEVFSGVCAEECSLLLKSFFKERR